MFALKPLVFALALVLAQAPTPDIHYVPTSNGVAEAMLNNLNELNAEAQSWLSGLGLDFWNSV